MSEEIKNADAGQKIAVDKKVTNEFIDRVIKLKNEMAAEYKNSEEALDHFIFHLFCEIDGVSSETDFYGYDIISQKKMEELKDEDEITLAMVNPGYTELHAAYCERR